MGGRPGKSRLISRSLNTDIKTLRLSLTTLSPSKLKLSSLMEDDDEFGDIYTDVLRPFSSSSAAASHSHELQATPPSLHRSFDLDIQSDDDKVLDGATNPNSATSDRATGQTLITNSVEPATEPIITRIGDSDPQLIACAKSEEREAGKNEGLARDEKNLASDSLEASGSRVLESEDVKLRDGTLGDSDYRNKSGVGDIEAEGGPEDGNLLDRSVKFDVEEVQNSGEFNGEDVHESVRFDAEEVEDGTGDVGSEQIIPGLSSGSSLIHGVSGEVGNRESMDIPAKDNASGEGDDWDSDSEDDLQIVLNDNNHGPMAMDRGGADEDEDGLLIVADGDDQIHQVMEEQEWGEDAAQTGDGERKETGDAAKANGGTAVPPKVGYSNHGYHPFHSQFKYVRPGAAPMPGAATTGPGGVPGQVRPLVNTGIIAGRGRGDWRPVGMKNGPPMQKNFQPGFGVPPWSNNTAGRGFSGGQEFSLPSYKTIFDYDIDGFEEKPWKHPGVDISDYFNFSLNEESWKDYCKQLEQLRLEATMQSKIRVYESGRTEQEYDPDLPPELAAAAGFNDVSVENANLARGDPGLGDLMKGSSRVRPPIPTGRAIQVEGGYGERLPSIDTRPPRIRDSDAIIEIVLQDAVDDDSSKGNGAQEQPDNELFREDLRADRLVEEDTVSVGTEFSDGFPRTYNGGKRDPVGRRAPSLNSARDNTLEGDGMSPFLPEAPVHHRAGSRSQTPVYSSRNSAHHDERRAQRRTRERSPHISPSESTRVNRFLDNPKEESVENMDGKDSPVVSSPASLRAAEELSLEQKDVVDNELVGGSPETERDGSLIASTSATVKDANSLQSVKKQKLSSRVEQPALQELDDGEDCKARSSENSKARSGSSKDYPKWRDGAEDEVIQDGRSARMGNIKRHLDEDEESYRRRDRDGRQEMERNRMVVKGREDSYPRKDWDSGTTHHLHMTTEFDRRKERENSDGAWQRRDADLHGRRIRTEETRKREYADEVGSRHWGKIRDIDKNDKDELGHSRKQLDNGSWRGHHDKDIESRHRERDDNTRNRYEIVDDLHNKRRKDEEHSRRDHVDKVEILHVQRESSSRRKRERDDGLDQRRRDDPPRIREQKDDGWLQRERVERQRERDERPRLKQSHEESLSKREREEVRAARSGRGAEDKTWVSHTKAKDEYKGSDKDYQMKDTGRHNELKRKDRLEDESVPHHRGRDDAYARGNQLNEDRRTRPDRSTSRNDRAVNASDNQRVHEKKHRDNTRKNKESEAVDHNTLGRSKRNQDDHLNAMVSLKGSYKQGNGQNDRQSSRKNKEDGSSDEEQQDSRKGRSKLERWTSHKDRDFTMKSSTSLKNKEVENISGGGSSLASKLSVPDDSAKSVEVVDNQQPPPLVEENVGSGDVEMKDGDSKPPEDRHLDTVAKLKKRSERFKLPMPSEKETIAVKKMESEVLPSVQNETPGETEIKQERPARKRRWVSS